jgi:ATP-binding cassette subfamily B protein
MKTIVRLLSYLKPYRAIVSAGILAMFVAQFATAALPWVIRMVIDNALIPAKYELLMPYIGAMAVVALFRASAHFVQRYSMESTAQKLIFDLRNSLYAHLQRLSFSYYDNAQTGQLMSRLTSDVETLRRLLGFGIVNMLSSAITFTLTLALLFGLHWKLALLSMCTMPLLLWVVTRFSAKVRPAYQRIQEQMATMTSVLQENVTGVRVVRAFAQEEAERAKFHEVNWEFFQRQLYAIRQWAYYFPMMNFISAVGTSMVLWYGGARVIQGEMTVGSLVAFNSYLLTLVGPLRMVGWVANLFQRAIASGGRVFEILDTAPAIEPRTDAVNSGHIQGAVKFDHVSFAYGKDDERPVLDDITIEAQPGQTIALLGATGSGKSTIIQLIPRFYDPTDGRILIDGINVRDMHPDVLRRQVGVVLQETFLFSTSIAENIAYGRPDANQEEIGRAAKAARIHDFIATLPEGYKTIVGERGVGLSGGQKQRVAIARALLTDPRILVLDDSLSSVDTETEHLIQQALAELQKGRTTFVIAQRLSTVKNADMIIVLKDGRVADQGTHEELMDKSGFYREIYDLQFKWQEDKEFLLGTRGALAAESSRGGEC